MSHNDLINEVTRQLSVRFQPVPLSIKRTIESLIEVTSSLHSVCECVDDVCPRCRGSSWRELKIANLIIIWFVFIAIKLSFLLTLSSGIVLSTI